MLKQQPCVTTHQRMYPKVKVRAIVQDDEEYDRPRSPLKGFNSLTIRNFTSPVKGVKQSSSVSVAKVPRSYIPRSATPPPSLPKSANKSTSEEDGNKFNTRASSLPRPRAVISSPDNDQILGSKNKMRFQRSSALKNHDLAHSRQSEGRCTRTNSTSSLKNQDLARSRQLEGRFTRTSTTIMKTDIALSRQTGQCARTSTACALKNHDLALNRQSEGKCTVLSMTSKKPLKRGECKEITHVTDANVNKGSAIDIRVPITNITKAKPCFMIT